MPKHSGLVSEFQAALKVCYDRRAVNDGWIPTGHAKQGIDGFTLYLYQEYHHRQTGGWNRPQSQRLSDNSRWGISVNKERLRMGEWHGFYHNHCI